MTPNEKTIAAMQESKEIIENGTVRFNTAEEMFDELGKHFTVEEFANLKYKCQPNFQ